MGGCEYTLYEENVWYLSCAANFNINHDTTKILINVGDLDMMMISMWSVINNGALL